MAFLRFGSDGAPALATVEHITKRIFFLARLFRAKSDFTLEHVREAILHEEDNDEMMKVVAMFDSGQDAAELQNVLELVTDAWNYFPHKALGGISPAEKLLEHHNKQDNKS